MTTSRIVDPGTVRQIVVPVKTIADTTGNVILLVCTLESTVMVGTLNCHPFAVTIMVLIESTVTLVVKQLVLGSDKLSVGQAVVDLTHFDPIQVKHQGLMQSSCRVVITLRVIGVDSLGLVGEAITFIAPPISQMITVSGSHDDS